MTANATARSNVVDLAAYRAAQAQRALPLEDGAPEPPAGGRRTGQTLSPRAVEHRGRMLRHLAGKKQAATGR